MNVVELRDLDAARRYVVEGLWLQREERPTAATVRPALEWALEVASGGHPLPPVGFVADVGHLAFGADADPGGTRDAVHVPGWPPTLALAYEDHVLGRLRADWTFERAGDALRRYAGKDRARGLAYVLKQLRERGGVGGVELSPAVVRGLLAAGPAELLAQGWDGLTRDGPMPLLVTQYEELVAAARRTAEVLADEDVKALEQRTALADMGQYVAHRQVLQTTARMLAALPHRPVRPLAGRREVPTRVHDEDQYPVGGYSSVSTRGSIESLLHSQLAYMEPVERPDLFDVKFVRDELFYYSRDENQFLRRRRAFAFVFGPDLAAARFKDPELPAQRIVLLVSAVVALVTKLTEWLSADALRFEVLFVTDADRRPLADEAALLGLLLREPLERGDAHIQHLPITDATAVVRELSRTSQVHCLAAGVAPPAVDVDAAVVTPLAVDGPRPGLVVGPADAPPDADDPFDAWTQAVLQVLRLWV